MSAIHGVAGVRDVAAGSDGVASSPWREGGGDDLAAAAAVVVAAAVAAGGGGAKEESVGCEKNGAAGDDDGVDKDTESMAAAELEGAAVAALGAAAGESDDDGGGGGGTHLPLRRSKPTETGTIADAVAVLDAPAKRTAFAKEEEEEEQGEAATETGPPFLQSRGAMIRFLIRVVCLSVGPPGRRLSQAKQGHEVKDDLKRLPSSLPSFLFPLFFGCPDYADDFGLLLQRGKREVIVIFPRRKHNSCHIPPAAHPGYIHPTGFPGHPKSRKKGVT